MQRLIAGARSLGLHLTPMQVEQFQIYYQELVDWNRRVNLTAIVYYEEVQVKHFLDSLTILALGEDVLRGATPRVIDVGSGAGLPGVPLKILCPGIRLTLLDSVAKKARFLQHLVAKLGLGDVEILTGRAEEVAHDSAYREQFDLALSRAVAALPSLAELTLPFCRVGGLFIAQKKGNVQMEVEKARKAFDTFGGELRRVAEVRLEGLEGRVLVIIDKVAPTPPAYPRRIGVPLRRPL